MLQSGRAGSNTSNGASSSFSLPVTKQALGSIPCWIAYQIQQFPTGKRRNIMIGCCKSCFVTIARAMALALLLTLGLFPTYASAADRKAPTTPTNLRVTGRGAYSVSLAWNPSTDNSGVFSYRVRHSWGYEATVPQTQTSFTWTGHVEPRQTYSFYVYAVDAAGNRSKNSNTVTVTLLADTTPPTRPVVSVAEVGSTHVTLSWTATDDGPFIWYRVTKNGSPVISLVRDTSATLYYLEPETTYTFTVQARDFAGHWSPVSDPVVVTTRPVNPNDTTPPTTPTNLYGDDTGDGSTEIDLFWTQSTDDFDPQSLIRYDVYVNGVFSDTTIGRGKSIVYGVFGSNFIEVIAIDTAGNQSLAATITVVVP
jgi:chitodextrinase